MLGGSGKSVSRLVRVSFDDSRSDMSDRSPERASGAASGRAGPRPALVFNVPAAGADITRLLGQRLIIVALLAALTSAFFSLFRMQNPAQWEYFQASTLGRGLLIFEPIMFVKIGRASCRERVYISVVA